MRKISIFGFTGSIGTQALELLDVASEFEPHIFVCNKSVDRAEKVLDKFQPKYIFFEDKDASNLFNSKKYPNVELIRNKQTLVDIIETDPSDIFLSAISSYEMMDITYLIAKSGKKVLLANKESLVVFGNNLMKEIDKHKTEIIPIDSEHYSIYHSLKNTSLDEIKKVFLMASGGPFFGSSISEIKNKSVEEALNHPNWEMGNKITIDSATLVNKCLEIVEAHYLFNLPFNKIKILIHPEAIVHSAVELNNFVTHMNLFKNDMKIPIYNFLLNSKIKVNNYNNKLLIKKYSSFNFQDVKNDIFPIYKFFNNIDKDKPQNLIKFNIGNEFAVNLFKNKTIKYTDIYKIIKKVTSLNLYSSVKTIKDVINYHEQIERKLQDIKIFYN